MTLERVAHDLSPTAFGGRTTTCRKASESFEFSVQCTTAREEDHLQIRFSGAAGLRTFIEVGCRVRP
jgi:hypothetical protein